MPLLPRRWYFRAVRARLYRRLVTVTMGSVVAAGIVGAGYLQMPAGDRPTASPSAAHFRNCDAARSAGATPIRRGEAGYAPHLDRDDDGHRLRAVTAPPLTAARRHEAPQRRPAGRPHARGRAATNPAKRRD
jgi:Excalibur calcium-binding domain